MNSFMVEGEGEVEGGRGSWETGGGRTGDLTPPEGRDMKNTRGRGRGWDHGYVPLYSQRVIMACDGKHRKYILN